jgi:hypothetical protein
MADYYRTLAQSLVGLGFLFRRQGEGHREVWRNRQTDREVIFDRDEVSKSRAAADAVLTSAQAGGLAVKAAAPADSESAIVLPAKSSPKSPPKGSSRQSSASKKPAPNKPVSKPSRATTKHKHAGGGARKKTKR